MQFKERANWTNLCVVILEHDRVTSGSDYPSSFIDGERFIRGNIRPPSSMGTQIICSPIKALQRCFGTANACEGKRLYEPDSLYHRGTFLCHSRQVIERALI